LGPRWNVRSSALLLRARLWLVRHQDQHLCVGLLLSTAAHLCVGLLPSRRRNSCRLAKKRGCISRVQLVFDRAIPYQLALHTGLLLQAVSLICVEASRNFYSIRSRSQLTNALVHSFLIRQVVRYMASRTSLATCQRLFGPPAFSKLPRRSRRSKRSAVSSTTSVDVSRR
jgi:hypothetical protein